MIKRQPLTRPSAVITPTPVPFSENDPNLRVYGPEGEVDPVEAVRRERRHQRVRELQRTRASKREIADRLGISIEEVEESLDPEGPRPRPDPRDDE